MCLCVHVRACACACVCVYVYMRVCTRGALRQLSRVRPLLLLDGSRAQTQVIRLSDKHLYLLTHLTGPAVSAVRAIWVCPGVSLERQSQPIAALVMELIGA